MSKNRIFQLVFLLCFSFVSIAQTGSFRGSLETNGKFFLRDENIDAVGTPQYDHQLFGSETWLDLTYSQGGFDLGARFDMFNNSNLIDPNGSYNDLGIGKWYIHKEIFGLDITAGYIYDQIASGAIFRAYEERPLAIDNALIGVRLGYELATDWNVTAFAGKQKNRFSQYDAVLKGAKIEGFFMPSDTSKFSVAPGFGVMNRTYDDGTMGGIIDVVKFYPEEERIDLPFNVFMFSLYNTMNFGPFSWYAEGNYKTPDVFYDPKAEKKLLGGGSTFGKLVTEPGTVFFSSLSYAAHGLGLTLSGKRTENFDIRTDPLENLNRGLLNFLPPMSRQQSYTLKSKYAAATQLLGEMAFQIDARYRINKKLSTHINFSNITDLDQELLYREIDGEVHYKKSRKLLMVAGLQTQWYNQVIYEGKTDVPMIRTLTPFVDIQYRFKPKRAIRFEGQYLSSEQNDGSWIFGLVEYTMAPKWSLELSDSYNIDPKKDGQEATHFPRIGATFSKRSNRIGLYYVKQVEGIVCTGGICRLEPAFSGVKLNISSTF